MTLALRRALEEEAGAVPFDRLQTLVDRLMTAYRSDDPQTIPPLESHEAVLAYAVYRMPGTYAAVTAALAASTDTTNLTPQHLVDLGGGTGAASWAAAAVFPDLASAVVLDRSRPALTLGRRLAGGGPKTMASAQWRHHVIGTDLPETDLGLAAYLLGELDPPRRATAVSNLADAATTVALVEPGTTSGYHRILAARDLLIDRGMRIAAPCPHEATCPLEGRDWCHFAARFDRSPLLRRLKRAEHGYEDEKFSYVVATRLAVSPPASRVIRHPQKRGGMVTLELCRGSGTAASVTITRREADTYRQARDTRWGDPWERRQS